MYNRAQLLLNKCAINVKDKIEQWPSFKHNLGILNESIGGNICQANSIEVIKENIID